MRPTAHRHRRTAHRLGRARPRAVRHPGLAQRRGAHVAYMNAQALQRTRDTGELHLWSRSRDELWHKGATSGNTQAVPTLPCASTATATRCSRWSSPPARPATTANAPASTAASSSRPRPTRSSRRSARSLRRTRPRAPRGSYTARSAPATRRSSARRCWRRPREVARAAREESDERVDEEAAACAHHLLAPLRSRDRSLAERRAGARWPSPLTSAPPWCPRWTRCAKRRGDYNLIPLRHTLLIAVPRWLCSVFGCGRLAWAFFFFFSLSL